MACQLRRYRLHAGTLDRFVELWRDVVVPLRAKFGFEVVGAWTAPEADTFVWIVSHPGDFAAAHEAYYGAPERTAMDPDPASFIAEVDAVMMAAVPGFPVPRFPAPGSAG